MKIYRIENAKGDGPWSGPYSICDAYTDAYGRRVRLWRCPPVYPSDMPGPCDDRTHEDHLYKARVGGFRDHVLFGWKTLGQMRRWFTPKVLQKLSEKGGYVLNVYEVPEAYVSDYQVTFDRRKATLIGQRPMK